MHVAITGARGMIGGALAESLRDHGHRVTGVTRSQPGSDELQWAPSEGRIDTDGLRGVDAVVHLAGEKIGFASWSPRAIADARWTADTRREILHSRVQGTTLLAETLADMDDGPRTLVSASAIGYYGDRGDETLTESSDSGDLFLSEVCRAWEASAQPARDAGLRVVHPRIGIVQTPRDGALQRSLPLFRAGLGGPFGSGRQWWSWVMLTDVIGVLHHAVTSDDVVGPINVTAPEPVTNGQWTKALGRVLGRPTMIPVPRFGPRLVFGEMADELIYVSARVLPEATLDSGYRFRYTDLEAGLRSVL
ncbi:MAG: TIGR01777 family oxidoreductase [Actinobacteria bacterium]|nr:TIGR01777 family oxidoreductase [Actinomycetota bacterium]